MPGATVNAVLYDVALTAYILAAAAAFVLSERASYMTGSIVRVDGGIVRTP
jgi:NAD(P)-dependent dehydrogenase (short-subunit alcohol dehydrogenase family)